MASVAHLTSNFVDMADTTLISVDYNVFIELLEANPTLSSKLDELYMGCFNSKFSRETYPENTKTFIIFALEEIISDEIKQNFFLNSDHVHLITAMTILSIYPEESYADVWGVCSNVVGMGKGHARIILNNILENIHDLSVVDLYVDYDNSFWNRAVSLYTSLGFVNPTNEKRSKSIDFSIFGKDFMGLRWTRGEKFNKEAARVIANDLRVQNYVDMGFYVSLLKMPIDHLNDIEAIAAGQGREYAGGIGTTFKQNGNVFYHNSVNITDPRVGSYIVQESPSAEVKLPENLFYFFHTHPDKIVNVLEVITAPPSVPDISNMLMLIGNGTYKQFVVESRSTGGIWSIQLNPYTIGNLCMNYNHDVFLQLHERVYKQLSKIVEVFFERIKEMRESFIGVNVDTKQVKYLRSLFVNAYLIEINQLTWESINIELPEYLKFASNLPIFLMEYHSWDYIDKTGEFMDWTITNPFGVGECKSMSKNIGEGLDFGYDRDELKVLLDAIDAVGEHEYQQCPRAEGETFETMVQKNICTDRWNGQHLLPLLERSVIYGLEPVVESIMRGEV